ncbi:MAG: GNAT family N-acetyltransferase, partial [Alphaproteobacteria bacterium]
RGDRFVVALRDGKVVGFENYQANLHWLGSGDRIGVRLDDDELWAVFSLVDPEYRRRGIVTDIIRFAGQKMREDGYRVVYGHIAEGDVPAKTAHGKRGFVPIDGWRIFRILGKTYFTSSFVRRKGRWSGARPLKVRVREASVAPGGPQGGQQGDREMVFAA